MTATIPSAALAVTKPVFSEPEQLALAGFLASYAGLTREAYMLDLRQFAERLSARNRRSAGPLYGTRSLSWSQGSEATFGWRRRF